MRVDWTESRSSCATRLPAWWPARRRSPTVRAWAESGDLAAADALAARQGWTGIGLDEDAGGQGGGTLELAVLAEQLGRGAVPWDRTLAALLAAPLLAPRAPRNSAAATAEGEPSRSWPSTARGPIGAPPRHRARARRYPRGTRCGRSLRRATGARRLRHRPRRSCSATTGARLSRDRRVGDELYAVAAAARSRSARVRSSTARRRSPTRGRRAPGAVLGSAVLRRRRRAAAVLVAADALGAATRLLELTAQYVGERKQFGVAVGSFQAVKHAAAEMLVDVEASRSAVMHGAWAVGAGEPDAARHASIAKASRLRRRRPRGRQGALPARRGRLHVGARPAVPVQAHQERRAAVRLARRAPATGSPTRSYEGRRPAALRRPGRARGPRGARPVAAARLGRRRAARGGAELARRDRAPRRLPGRSCRRSSAPTARACGATPASRS